MQRPPSGPAARDTSADFREGASSVRQSEQHERTHTGRHGWSLARPLHLAITVPHDPAAIGVVRRVVCSAADPAGTETAEVLGLIFTELVTNAVVHASVGDDASIAVELTLSRQRISGHVVDQGPGFALPDGPQPRVDGGFGLFIVQRLVGRWGIDVTDDATGVWFEL